MFLTVSAAFVSEIIKDHTQCYTVKCGTDQTGEGSKSTGDDRVRNLVLDVTIPVSDNV